MPSTEKIFPDLPEVISERRALIASVLQGIALDHELIAMPKRARHPSGPRVWTSLHDKSSETMHVFTYARVKAPVGEGELDCLHFGGDVAGEDADVLKRWQFLADRKDLDMEWVALHTWMWITEMEVRGEMVEFRIDVTLVPQNVE